MLGKLAVVCAFCFLGFALFRVFAPDSSRQPAHIPRGLEILDQKPHKKHEIQPQQTLTADINPFDLKPYSVAMVDTNKNKIPTGTQMLVQGQLFDVVMSPGDDCTRLLAGQPLPLQHGEVDPALYCRFSILLTERLADGGEGWPALGLICDVTPQIMGEVTKRYHPGDTVQVKGSYAASLDFEAARSPGGHFGEPVLEDCTFTTPAE